MAERCAEVSAQLSAEPVHLAARRLFRLLRRRAGDPFPPTPAAPPQPLSLVVFSALSAALPGHRSSSSCGPLCRYRQTRAPKPSAAGARTAQSTKVQRKPLWTVCTNTKQLPSGRPGGLHARRCLPGNAPGMCVEGQVIQQALTLVAEHLEKQKRYVMEHLIAFYILHHAPCTRTLTSYAVSSLKNSLLDSGVLWTSGCSVLAFCNCAQIVQVSYRPLRAKLPHAVLY